MRWPLKQSGWRIGAGLLAGGVALWLAARGTGDRDLRAAVAGADARWVLLALASVIVTVAAGVVRWRILFYPEARNRSWRTLTAAFIVGQMLNIVLPLRVGEMARAAWASRAEGIPLGRTLGTMAMERLADLVTVGGVVSALLALSALPGWLATPGRALIGTAAVAAGIILLVAFSSRSLADAGKAIAGRLPRAIGARLERLAATALEGTRVLDSGTATVLVAVLSVLVLMLATSTNYLLFFAFGLRLSVAAAIVLVIALQAANSLISVPGNLGVFEYATVLTLSAYSVDRDVAFAYAILLHVIALVPKVIAGALFLAFGPPRSAPTPG